MLIEQFQHSFDKSKRQMSTRAIGQKLDILIESVLKMHRSNKIYKFVSTRIMHTFLKKMKLLKKISNYLFYQYLKKGVNSIKCPKDT